MVITKESLLAALNERDLFNNPDQMEAASRDIDCSPHGCAFLRVEAGTNATECSAMKSHGWCSSDVAETLRALAALARRDGE